MFDLISSFFLIALLLLIGFAYMVRLVLRGSERYERVERQGGGVLLGTSVMQMGYWGMQPLGRLFAFLRITPNQISAASLVLGAVAAICLGAGRFGVAAVFMVMAAVLDGLDGMVARMTGTVSSTGGLVDSVIDRYVEFFLFIGMAFYYRTHPWIQVLCMAALFGSLMVSYSTAKAEILGVRLPSGGLRRPERLLYLFIGTVLSPLMIPYEDAAAGRPLAYPLLLALVFVAALSNFSAVQRFWFIGRQAEESPEA